MKVELSGHYGYGRIVKSMVPVMGMMVINSIYTVVDGYFISNYAGNTAFAAMNIVWPVLAIISALGLMIGSGGSALVSKTFGEGNPHKACLTFTNLVKVCIGIGIVLGAITFILMKPLVILLGAEGEMVGYAMTYGRIIISILPAFMLQMMFQSFYMTAEKPQMGTTMSLLCGCINILLDALFVVVFDWGLTGAAIATAVSLLVGGVYPVVFFSSWQNRTHLHFRRGSVDWRAVAKSCSNGASEFVQSIALNVVSICYNLQLMKYLGENGVSAYGVTMYAVFFFVAAYLGYNMGITQVIAYNFGAKDKVELRSLFKKSMVIITLGSALAVTISEVAAPLIARIFVGFDTGLMDLSVKAIRCYMISFLFCGFNMFCSAWFTAFGNGGVSAFSAFLRTGVFELASVFILPALFGIDAIWFSVVIAEILDIFVTLGLFLHYNKDYLAD